jgi:glycosyltransferase involved in cell wall biosynthesis
MYDDPLKHPSLTEIRKPRIGIYEPSVSRSGPSRYVDSILDGIDPREFDVVLFCRAGGPYGRRDNVERIFVGSAVPNILPGRRERPAQPNLLRRTWRALTPAPLKLWSGFTRETLRLAAAFRSRSVDLLHTNSAGCEESAVAARLAGIPRVVGTFHVDSTYDLSGVRSGLRHRVIECLSNHCLHAAIAVSEATRQNWLRRTRLRPSRVTTIHNGVDAAARTPRRRDRAGARERLGLPGYRLVIGGIGRLDPAKGFHDLIDAVSLLAPGNSRVALALAGQGPLRSDLEAHATQLGVRDRVHFLGFQRNVADVYDAIDIFALPSVCEALPYALLEAMTSELPVVATTVGGVPEVVADGETGFLVPARSPEALARALRPLLDEPELRRRLGRAGRDRVSAHFDQRDMVARTLRVYRQMLGRLTFPIPTAMAA